MDQKLARSQLDTGEFVFDVQGHFVNPTGAWTQLLPAGAQPLKFFAQNKVCEARDRPGLDGRVPEQRVVGPDARPRELPHLECLGLHQHCRVPGLVQPVHPRQLLLRHRWRREQQAFRRRRAPYLLY